MSDDRKEDSKYGANAGELGSTWDNTFENPIKADAALDLLITSTDEARRDPKIRRKSTDKERATH